MSVYRCEMHGARIAGALETAYVSAFRGSTSYSRRLRLCPSCLDGLLSDFVEYGTFVETDADDIDESLCCTCGSKFGGDITDGDPVRVTYYRRKAEQRDVLGLCCSRCFATAKERYKLELRPS